MSKTKVHTRYVTDDGIKVVGVTTVLGLLAKPALIDWAWKLGCAGKDYKKVREEAADVGTIAHELIRCHLKGEKADLGEYSKNNIDKAETAFLAYLDFEKKNALRPIYTETAYVSNQYQYGGTIDLYGETSQGLTLIDFKTSSGLYPEMRVQVAAYKNLLAENGHPVQSCAVLRIDKETGEFNHHQLNGLNDEWELFKALLPVYRLKKQIWKEN